MKRDPGEKVFSVAFYGFGGLCGLWLLVSVLSHLYGSKDIQRTLPAIHKDADKPEELYRCWENTYSLFNDLLYDFGNEIILMRRHTRNLKSTWGEKYGWDLLPANQLPARHKTLEKAGVWRYKMLETWSWCRLGETDVVEKSAVLELLRDVHTSLDVLRLGLTKRMRSLSESERTQLEGGAQKLIREVRRDLKKAGKLSIKLMRDVGKTPDQSKLRKWRLNHPRR